MMTDRVRQRLSVFLDCIVWAMFVVVIIFVIGLGIGTCSALVGSTLPVGAGGRNSRLQKGD